MTRDEIALQIYVKRLPPEPLLENNQAWFMSRATEAFKLADMFLSQKNSEAPALEADTSPSGLEVEE